MKKYWTEEKIKSAKYDSLLNKVEEVKKEADELMMKKIDHYEKELALVREDAQIQILRLDKRIGELAAINSEHQKLNGELREDNKKLAKQVDDYVNKLRKAGLV